jgi:hypothetical protein
VLATHSVVVLTFGMEGGMLNIDTPARNEKEEVRCKVHGTVTTWGALNWIQRLAVDEGLDTEVGHRCVMSPEIA